MMKKKSLTTILFFYYGATFLSLLCCLQPIQAEDEILSPHWSLRFGPSLALSEYQSFSTSSPPTLGIGVMSEVQYKINDWSVALRSDAFVSQFRHIQHKAKDSLIYGRFEYQRIALVPLVKYQWDFSPWDYWFTELFFGPMIGLKTFKSRKVSLQGGSYFPHQKFTMDSYGFCLGVNLQEQTVSKKFHLFYSLSYQYFRGKKISVIGGTHTEVETLSQENINYQALEQSVIFSLGMLII